MKLVKPIGIENLVKEAYPGLRFGPSFMSRARPRNQHDGKRKRGCLSHTSESHASGESHLETETTETRMRSKATVART